MNIGPRQINQTGSVVRFDATCGTDKRLHFQKLDSKLKDFAKTTLSFNKAPPNKDQTVLGEHMKTVVKESGVTINLDGAENDIDILTKIGQHIHDSLENGGTLTNEQSTLNDDMYLLIKLAHKCKYGSSIFEGMNRDRYSFNATGNKVGTRPGGKPDTAWASFFKDCKVCNDLHTSPTADKGLTYVGEKVPEEKIKELIVAIAGGKSALSSGSIVGDLNRLPEGMRVNATVDASPGLPKQGSIDDGVIAGNVHFNPNFRDDLGINPNGEVPEDLEDSFRNIKTMKGAMDGGLEGLATLKDDKSGATVDQIQINDLAKKLGVESKDVKGKTFEDIGEMARVKINNDAATKIQTAFRGNQGRAEANKQRLQKAMAGDLDGIKDLSGPTTVGSLGLDEAKVTQLATMLGSSGDEIKGQTFKDIGEMAQAKINKDTSSINMQRISISDQARDIAKLHNAMRKSSNGLKDLTGSTIVDSLQLPDLQVTKLANMLGSSGDEIKGQTFKQIGEMAAKVRPEYAPLKSVTNCNGTNRLKVPRVHKFKAPFDIANVSRKEEGLPLFFKSLTSNEFNFTQLLDHCEKLKESLKESTPSNFSKDEMIILLIHNKYSLQEQCLTMNESDFNTHYLHVYDQMSFFGSGRDALIKELFKDIKIQDAKSPDFNKLYRGEAVA